jgi:FkbM family methyltransferase
MPEFDRWSADNGDATHRLNYCIGRDDVVIDCGAYHGAWSRAISDRFHCKILAFEPVYAFYSIAAKALIGTLATVYHAGIGPEHKFCKISVAGDASSILEHSGPLWQTGHEEQIEIISLDEIFRRHNLSTVRLMKINIEGAEYDLLDYMIDVDLATRIDDIQIQFHDFVPDASQRRDNIRERLTKTHTLTYDYEFVWENWRIKDR